MLCYYPDKPFHGCHAVRPVSGGSEGLARTLIFAGKKTRSENNLY